MGPPAPGLNIGVPHDRSHTRAPPSRGGMQGSPIPRSRRGSPPPPFPGGYCCVSSLGSDTGVPRSPGTHATPHPEGHPKRATGVPHLGGGGAHTKEGLTQGTPPRPVGSAAGRGRGQPRQARPQTKRHSPRPRPCPAPSPVPRAPSSAPEDPSQRPTTKWSLRPPSTPGLLGSSGGTLQDPSLVCCRMSSA